MICAAVDLYEKLLFALLEFALLEFALLEFVLLEFALFGFVLLFFLVNGGVMVNDIISFHKFGKSVRSKREISSTFFSLAAFLFTFFEKKKQICGRVEFSSWSNF